MSSFDIYLDDDNEIRFGVNVEGSERHDVKCRMMMEASNSMSLFFPGNKVADGEVQVIVPSLKNVLKEGTYPVKLEVIIDDRIFTPLEASVNVRRSVKVTAEAIVTPVRKSPSVTANILSEVVEASPPPPKKQPAKKRATKERPTQKSVRENRGRRKTKTIKQSRQKSRQSSTLSDREFAKLIESLSE